ncbi:MAG: HAMP domain-containing histidine kinase, partial [Thermoplasmata archaeon]|nr:HAMP domain-containing histidine kinase [Thermoplasmata archaeon]
RIGVGVRETGGGAQVSVSDRGMGITPEGIPKLFQKFGRVDDDRRRGIAGTGLGLYICRSIVESHGGRIWVESEPDKGATFHFWIPGAREQGADPAGKA